MKEEKSGFTLIELLAVLALIGVIAGIAFMAIGGLIERSKQKEYESKCDLIMSKALEFFHNHKDDVGDKFTLEDVIAAGYLKDDLDNPVTNEKFNKKIEFEISQTDEGVYQLNKDNEEWCE